MLRPWGHRAAGRLRKAGRHLAPPADRGRSRAGQQAWRKGNPETEYVPSGPARLGYDHWQAYNFHCSYNKYWFYEDTPERLTREGFETDILMAVGEGGAV